MSNQLFTAFIKWVYHDVRDWEYDIHRLAALAREALNDTDTIEQQALNYFIDQYDSITQS